MTDNAVLCRAYQAGDPFALDQLIAKNRKYVRDVSVEYYNANADICKKLGIDEEDLTQIGQVKMCRLAAGYDPQRGACFETYCKLPLVNAMTDAVRTGANAQKYELENRDYDWDPDVEAAAELAQFRYPEPEPACIRKETMEELQAALAEISDRDLTYLTYRFGLNGGAEHRPSDTARHFGLRPASQKRAEQEALRHIRQQMP